MNTETTDISESKQRQLANLKPFIKGVSGNPAGRPKGSLSVIGSIKQMFEEDPEQFQDFINKYLKDPRNRQHIVEMIDGRPKGSETQIAVQVNNIVPTHEMKKETIIDYVQKSFTDSDKEELRGVL
jgi:hypothetical protein